MAQPRAWQKMLSGRRLDLLDPTPVDIEIEDIARGLSFVARWNGQTEGAFAYSVAEHSLLVERPACAARAKGAAEMAAGGAAARCARIRDRRPDFAGEGGRRPRLRGARPPACRGDPSALRPARHAAPDRQAADQARRQDQRLDGGDADCRVHGGRSDAVLRQAGPGDDRGAGPAVAPAERPEPPMSRAMPSWSRPSADRPGASARRPFRQDALQRPAMHVQPPRRFGDVVIAQLVDTLDMLPPHAVGAHRVFRRRGKLFAIGQQRIVMSVASAGLER